MSIVGKVKEISFQNMPKPLRILTVLQLYTSEPWLKEFDDECSLHPLYGSSNSATWS